MGKLETIRGVGTIAATTCGKITAVAGVGAVAKVQAVNGSGNVARTSGCGNINGK